MKDPVICPGCGWTGVDEGLVSGECPACGYGKGEPPYRLLKLSELELDVEGQYMDVCMGKFLKSVKKAYKRA